jgi:hypothetical protein
MHQSRRISEEPFHLLFLIRRYLRVDEKVEVTDPVSVFILVHPVTNIDRANYKCVTAEDLAELAF